MLFYFTKIFLNFQPPPSTPWFVMLTWFAMLGVERFAMLGWDFLGVDLCCDVFLNFLNSIHLSLSDTDSRLPCWHGFVMLTRFAMLGTDLLSFVFLSYLNSNHLSLFQARARVFHAATVCHADTVLPCLTGNGFP